MKRISGLITGVLLIGLLAGGWWFGDRYHQDLNQPLALDQTERFHSSGARGCVR